MAYNDLVKIIEGPNYQIHVDEANPENSDSPQDADLIQSMHDKHATKFNNVIELFNLFKMNDDQTRSIKFYNKQSDLPATGDNEIIYLINDTKELLTWDENSNTYVSISANSNNSNSETIIEINSDKTINSSTFVICDTTGSTIASDQTAYTITLDHNLPDKTKVIIMDGSGNAEKRPIKLVSSENIYINGSQVSNFEIHLNVNYFFVTLLYNAANSVWHIGNK